MAQEDSWVKPNTHCLFCFVWQKGFTKKTIITTDFQLTIRIINLEIWKNWKHWISSKVALNFKNRRIGAFELCCWRRFLRISWTVRRSNQSILKENNPEYSLEGLMLKLKLQYFSHLMWRANSLEKTCCCERLKAGGEGGARGRGGCWHHQLNGHDFEQALRQVKYRKAWHAAVHGIANSQTQLRDWTIKTNERKFENRS